MIRTPSRSEYEISSGRGRSSGSELSGPALCRLPVFLLLAVWVAGVLWPSASAQGLDGRNKQTDLWTFLTTLDQTRDLLETDQAQKARNMLVPLQKRWSRGHYAFIFHYTTGRVAYDNGQWKKAMGHLRAASKSELVRHAPETLFFLGMAFRQLEIGAPTETESAAARKSAIENFRSFLRQPSRSKQLWQQAKRMVAELAAGPSPAPQQLPSAVAPPPTEAEVPAARPPESQIAEVSAVSDDGDRPSEEPEPEGEQAPTKARAEETTVGSGPQVSPKPGVEEALVPRAPGPGRPVVETRGSTIVWAGPVRSTPGSGTPSQATAGRGPIPRFDLSRFAGEILVLHFWATWCAPCQTELPSFIAFVTEEGASLRQEGAEVSLVTLDKFLSSGEGFLKSCGFGGLRLHHDPGYELLRALTGTVEVPQTIVIHKDADQPADVIPTSDWESRETRDRLWRALDRADHP